MVNCILCNTHRKSGGYYTSGIRDIERSQYYCSRRYRNSTKLLNHFDIKTPMTSYHEYNKIDKAYVLMSQLQEGANIALITDAGTPGNIKSGRGACGNVL